MLLLLFYWLQATVQRWDCDPFFGVFHDMLLFVKSIESICDKRMMLIYDMGFFVCCLFLSLSVFCPLVCLCAREYLCLVRIIDPNSNKLRLICHHSSEIVSIIVRRTLSITLAADQTIEAITIQVIKSMPCQFHLPFFPPLQRVSLHTFDSFEIVSINITINLMIALQKYTNFLLFFHFYKNIICAIHSLDEMFKLYISFHRIGWWNAISQWELVIQKLN